jgi:hypothetical protein
MRPSLRPRAHHRHEVQKEPTMVDSHLVLSLARLATAALAATISVFAARAYLNARRPSILTLAAGAGLLAAGYLAEGLLVEIAGWTLGDATALESIVTLLSIGILVASLYVKEARLASSGSWRALP